jgi:hypothetical protein
MAQATTTGERWTLDGDEIDLGSFLSDNREDLTVADAERFAAMHPGEEILLGGGAGATFVLRREA